MGAGKAGEGTSAQCGVLQGRRAQGAAPRSALPGACAWHARACARWARGTGARASAGTGARARVRARREASARRQPPPLAPATGAHLGWQRITYHPTHAHLASPPCFDAQGPQVP